MSYFPRIKTYKTSVSYLVRNGLIGEQSVNDLGFPNQSTLDDIEPFKAFQEDPIDRDFDPIRLSLEKAWEEAHIQNDVESSKSVNNE